jgi:hypothetical protein
VFSLERSSQAIEKPAVIMRQQEQFSGSSILTEGRESKMKLGLFAYALSLALGSTVWGQAPAVVKPGDLRDRAGRFKAGDMAPDFNLKVMHKETRVMLSAFRNQRPVAVVFGSYT